MKKNNKLLNDIVLVGFQTHEFGEYKKVKESIEGLDFNDSIEKLESLSVWFKPFYKNENIYQDLEGFGRLKAKLLLFN